MEKRPTDWKEAIDALIHGNERFVNGRSADNTIGHTKLKELAQNGQRPFATVLSCSDSRVPAELIFDCGFGDLFVIRVAGNVVQPSQIASIEYAAKILGASLCVVMGHTKCGAIQAASDTELGKGPDLGPNIEFLIELIRPAIQDCFKGKVKSAEDLTPEILDECSRKNVQATANEILAQSSLLRSLTQEKKFKVVEALFRLETGKVDFRN